MNPKFGTVLAIAMVAQSIVERCRAAQPSHACGPFEWMLAETTVVEGHAAQLEWYRARRDASFALAAARKEAR